MNDHNITETLSNAVTDAATDRMALADVAGIVKVALNRPGSVGGSC